MAADVYYV